MKRYLFMFLAVMIVSTVMFSAMAVEAQSLFQPIPATSLNVEDTTYAANQNGYQIDRNQLFLFGVTVGVMAALSSLTIVLLVSGQSLMSSKGKRRVAQKKRA